MKSLFFLVALVSASAMAQEDMAADEPVVDCQQWLDDSSMIYEKCVSCPTLFLTPYLDTFKGLCALNALEVAEPCYDSQTFRVCWSSLHEQLAAKGLSEAAEVCGMRVPQDLVYDAEGKMRSSYELCELPALDKAVHDFYQCVNVQMVPECGVTLMSEALPEYTCPDSTELGPRVADALTVCTADPENAPEGWYNTVKERPPRFYTTDKLCVLNQLGLMSLTQRTFILDVDGMKELFGEDLFNLARDPTMEGDDRFGYGEYHRAARFRVNELVREFFFMAEALCGAECADQDMPM